MAELVREIMIDARPETIWPFLTDPEKHVEWNGTKADIDPKPGGTYRVLVAGQYPSAGEYVEVVPHEKVVFTFGWEQEGNRYNPARRPLRSPCCPRATRPACVWCTVTCRRRRSTTTVTVGRITSSGWRLVPLAATRDRIKALSGPPDEPYRHARPGHGGDRGHRGKHHGRPVRRSHAL